MESKTKKYIQHKSKIDNQIYEIGRLEEVNYENKLTGKTFDIIVILYSPLSNSDTDTFEDVDTEFIGLYYGGYDWDITEGYIESYLEQKQKTNKILVL